MDVNASNQNFQVASAAAPAPVTPVDKAAENREVVQAVKALNGTEMFGQDNVLTFQKDRQTNKMVIRMVNKKTQEVVSQIPPEYVLRLACDARSDEKL
ncbi:MAG TPA: flagellar protein FlaG [Bryobacteraceae bacterium]|nr:flagellar protein FlaG [Bryobacteraceae bacterium]